MPLVEMQVGDQAVRHDRDATARIYASKDRGWAEQCGCVGCRNYLAQRDAIYPVAFTQLLDRLGIDSKKDAEVVADGPLKNGLHHYGGWFFFAGEMLRAGETLTLAELMLKDREHIQEVCPSPFFAFWFTSVGPCPQEFRAEAHLAIEFEAHVKWVLAESWDSDSRPARGPSKEPGSR